MARETQCDVCHRDLGRPSRHGTHQGLFSSFSYSRFFIAFASFVLYLAFFKIVVSKVENSAYNGINVTMPGSGVTISFANITGNRGYGVFLNSTRGDITLEHSSITNNMADGVKLHVHDRRPETKVIDGVDVHDFCTYSTSYTQTYPV